MCKPSVQAVHWIHDTDAETHLFPNCGLVDAEGKARPHRWAPEAGYVTLMVDDEADLEPALDLIRVSHDHFAGKWNLANGTPKNKDRS